MLYWLSSGGQSSAPSDATKYLFCEAILPWFPLPFSSNSGGADRYCPALTLGFCVVWLRIRDSLLRFAGAMRRWRTSCDIDGRDMVTSSCHTTSDENDDTICGRTSKDWAYQSWTLLIEGISLKPSGNSLSSCTRCARRMGSSSDRNCEARNRVPGRSDILTTERWASHTRRGSLAKLDHLPQTNAGGREAGIVLDGVHQLVALLPRHAGGCRRPHGPLVVPQCGGPGRSRAWTVRSG